MTRNHEKERTSPREDIPPYALPRLHGTVRAVMSLATPEVIAMSLPPNLAFISMACIHCKTVGQLPVLDGVVQVRTCWSWERRLKAEGKDWRRR